MTKLKCYFDKNCKCIATENSYPTFSGDYYANEILDLPIDFDPIGKTIAQLKYAKRDMLEIKAQALQTLLKSKAKSEQELKLTYSIFGSRITFIATYASNLKTKLSPKKLAEWATRAGYAITIRQLDVDTSYTHRCIFELDFNAETVSLKSAETKDVSIDTPKKSRVVSIKSASELEIYRQQISNALCGRNVPRLKTIEEWYMICEHDADKLKQYIDGHINYWQNRALKA